MKMLSDKTQYRARIIDAAVKRYLGLFGAVCIEGTLNAVERRGLHLFIATASFWLVPQGAAFRIMRACPPVTGCRQYLSGIFHAISPL